jgi:hypothetical protein
MKRMTIVRRQLKPDQPEAGEKLDEIVARIAGEVPSVSYGKWSQPEVPHKGWVCVGMDDVGDDLITCEMCETAQVRYVHHMKHDGWPEALAVGYVCAGAMERDYVAAGEREKAFKRKQKNPEREKKRQYDLDWLDGITKVLAVGGLSEREEDFVLSLKWRMEASIKARTRVYWLSPRQKLWFRDIYLRVVGR